MRLNYRYRLTESILSFCQKLTVLQQALEIIPQIPGRDNYLRRESWLKSALFSARIEGNRLNLDDVINEPESSQVKAKMEVFNLFKAINWLYSSAGPKKINQKTILKLHQLTMNNLTSGPGRWRRQAGAIFNQAGVAIYLAPPAQAVPQLIEKMLLRWRKNSDPVPARAAWLHFTWEKIHPFIDGNGRVGRLLIYLALKQGGLNFKGLLNLDECLEQNRQTYYDLLAKPGQDITEFIEFVLSGMVTQGQKIIDRLKEPSKEPANLLPRRQEILNIIKDHQTVSFDFLRRRFMAVSASTLHYDLQQLLKMKLIKKLGVSRGARYSPTSSVQ